MTDRRCGICLECCNARDEMNKRIDAGLEAYIPPDKRPGHRFYKGERKLSEAKRAVLMKATAARMAEIDDQMRQDGAKKGEDVTLDLDP